MMMNMIEINKKCSVIKNGPMANGTMDPQAYDVRE